MVLVYMYVPGKSLATACVTDDVVHIDDVAFVLFAELVESWAAPKESEALSTRTISSIIIQLHLDEP